MKEVIMIGNIQKNEKSAMTKLMAIFFPLKPLKNKFSDNFISTQICDFIPKLEKYSGKAILYKIDKEKFYTYDLKTESFDNKCEIVDNLTVVIIFSVDKMENVDVGEMFEEDFFKSINTIRIHRKRVDPSSSVLNRDAKPSYVFYTINSTKLLNKIIPILQGDDESSLISKTFFILSANSAKRDIDPLEKSFSTEKICRMNYISTIDLKRPLEADNSFMKLLRRKLYSQIKF